MMDITVPIHFAGRARKHGLNISGITEQALIRISDHLETQNIKNTEDMSNCVSNSL